jgi:hypothetical protein
LPPGWQNAGYCDGVLRAGIINQHPLRAGASCDVADSVDWGWELSARANRYSLARVTLVRGALVSKTNHAGSMVQRASSRRFDVRREMKFLMEAMEFRGIGHKSRRKSVEINGGCN